MDTLNSYNKEMLDYIVKEIGKKKGTPFHMSNPELADELSPFIEEAFPEAIMVKSGISQWITVSTKAQNTLIKQLNNRRKEHEKAILEIDRAINLLTD